MEEAGQCKLTAKLWCEVCRGSRQCAGRNQLGLKAGISDELRRKWVGRGGSERIRSSNSAVVAQSSTESETAERE
eukprot:scaffold363476_cov96-Cyclotella_meneghiniana.AAC.1